MAIYTSKTRIDLEDVGYSNKITNKAILKKLEKWGITGFTNSKRKNHGKRNNRGKVKFWYCSRVGTFGTESAVRKRGGSRNLPYLNAKPRQIPLLGTYA